MNVTLSIDDRVVAKARRIAAARGTTLNQPVSDHLKELTRGNDMDSVVRRVRRDVVRANVSLVGTVVPRRSASAVMRDMQPGCVVDDCRFGPFDGTG